MKGRRLVLFRGDRALWIIVALLCVISILVVYSSTASMAYREVGGDTSYYVLRQFRFIMMGFFATIVVHWIPPRFYLSMAGLLFWISVTLTLLTYVIGVELNDASRWIRLPIIGLTFLPSDPLKIALMMVLATQIGKRQAIIDKIPILPALTPKQWSLHPHKNLDIFIHTTKKIVLPIAIAALAVMPANLSTAVIIVIVALVVLIVGRVQKAQIWKLILVAFVTMAVVVSVMKVLGIGRADTWVNRIESYVMPIFGGDDALPGSVPEDEFQKEQARIAVASGGVIGKGPGNSTQRSQLPHPYSDFAYAFIIEEYGIVGGLGVLVLYLWIFYRAGVIMRKNQKPIQSLLVLGLSLIITIQAFVNMGVSVGLIPVTGQSLPLISLGGSSVLFTCISFGMILGISRESDEAEAEMIAQQRRLKAQRESESDYEEQDIPTRSESNGSELKRGKVKSYRELSGHYKGSLGELGDEFVVTQRNSEQGEQKPQREVYNLDD